MRSRAEYLQGMRETHAEIGERLANATVDGRAYELLRDLHNHLGEVIRISEELLALEPEEIGSR